MKRQYSCARAFAFWFLPVAAAMLLVNEVATAQPSTQAQPTNAIVCIVTLQPSANQDALLKEHGIQARRQYRHALNGFAAALRSEQIDRLKHDPRVLAVEPDGRVYPASQSVGNGVVRMGITNFPVAHINGHDNRIDVDVAVLDTGIQTNHPDLNVVNAVGFVGIPPGSPGYNGDDWDGHGTRMAGNIGALDNDFGVVGVAPGARLWSVQVLGPAQLGWAPVVAGLDYVAANADRISVVNASIQGFGSTPTNSPYFAVHTAFSNVVYLGVVVVAAAGNYANDISGDDLTYGTTDDILPAALPEVMTVSATFADSTNAYYDSLIGYSDYSLSPKSPSYVTSPGAGIDVAAPGYNILSTDIGSSYSFGSGTSEATAHVTGLVALYIAANGRAHTFEDVMRIRQAIVDNSQPQSQWHPQGGNTFDPDGNPEPLAFPSENWVPQPLITGISNTAASVEISFRAVPGYSYTVQSAPAVNSSAVWTNFSTVTGTGSVTITTFTDPNPGTTRFYRLFRESSP